MTTLAWCWRTFLSLVRDLAGTGQFSVAEADPVEMARHDDVLDAWFDDDGMDASGS
jgi:hypothetical protein